MGEKSPNLPNAALCVNVFFEVSSDANDKPSGGRIALVRSIRKVWAIGFWLLFAVATFLHMWIGEVVVDYRIEGSQHLMKLRDQPGEWTSVSTTVFWAHLIVKYSMLAACVLVAAWALWRWLWYGSLRQSK